MKICISFVKDCVAESEITIEIVRKSPTKCKFIGNFQLNLVRYLDAILDKAEKKYWKYTWIFTQIFRSPITSLLSEPIANWHFKTKLFDKCTTWF
jgi:hypothetical protein